MLRRSVGTPGGLPAARVQRHAERARARRRPAPAPAARRPRHLHPARRRALPGRCRRGRPDRSRSGWRAPGRRTGSASATSPAAPVARELSGPARRDRGPGDGERGARVPDAPGRGRRGAAPRGSGRPRASRGPPDAVQARAAMVDAMEADKSFAAEQRVGEFHVYSLPGRSSLLPGLTTTVALFAPAQVKYERHYVVRGLLPFWGIPAAAGRRLGGAGGGELHARAAAQARVRRPAAPRRDRPPVPGGQRGPGATRGRGGDGPHARGQGRAAHGRDRVRPHRPAGADQLRDPPGQHARPAGAPSPPRIIV